MKFLAAFAIFGLGVGITSTAFGQGDHAAALPTNSPSNTTTGAGTTSKNPSSAAPSATPEESNTDESDDTLYRGKSSESENPMAREEGRLHFKTRPKEKVQEVDSLKNLQSSGSDPKFRGSLLHSAVTDIDNVNPKANDTRDAEDEDDPRFKTKRLVFKADKQDESKQGRTDSTPSPTPSPTASPAAKNSSSNPSPD
jgi:hypothetical protein